MDKVTKFELVLIVFCAIVVGTVLSTLLSRADSTMDVVFDNGGNVNLTTGGVIFEAQLAGLTKPDCAVTYRGLIWADYGTLGAADTFWVCQKTALDTYAWNLMR